MNPDLEFFLESALDPISPTSDSIGRVVVEPDYDVDFSSSDADALRAELVQFLQAQHANAAAVASHQGAEIAIPANFPLLAKYIRKVTFHADKADGSWIEVAPPGNWI